MQFHYYGFNIEQTAFHLSQKKPFKPLSVGQQSIGLEKYKDHVFSTVHQLPDTLPISMDV